VDTRSEVVDSSVSRPEEQGAGGRLDDRAITLSGIHFYQSGVMSVKVPAYAECGLG